MARILILSDLHVPLHHKDAVQEALDRIQAWRPGNIVLLGDVLDSYSISSFSKDPDGPKFQAEIDETKAVLAQIRSAAGKNCRIDYVEGNHEDRLRRLLWDVPALHGLDALKIPNLLGFPAKNYYAYNKDNYLKINELAFHHGGETRRNNENTAKDRLTCAGPGTRIICIGHTHRMSVTYVRDRAGIGISVEAGCLADPKKADYLKAKKLWDVGWVEIVTDTGHQLPRVQPIFL